MIHEQTPMVEVAIIIVGYNALSYIDDCLTSIEAADKTGLTVHTIVVDNQSPDPLADHVTSNYPWAHLVVSAVNSGFTGGNNLGWRYVQERFPNANYIYLLNQDTIVDANFLTAVIEVAQSTLNAAAVQSKLRLHPDTGTLNSAGNCSQYLGFGFTRAYGETDQGQYDKVETLAYPSGAAVLLDTRRVREVGLFEDEMFLYLEDADLGWKLRQIGYDVVFAPRSIVFHKFSFDSTLKAYYYLERNRWWLLLVYYKLATLILLIPPLVAMECAQLGYSLLKGIPGQKLRAMTWFMKPAHVRRIWKLRRQAQSRRVVSDRAFLATHTGRINAPMLRSPILDYIMNPLMAAYWRIAYFLIRW